MPHVLRRHAARPLACLLALLLAGAATAGELPSAGEALPPVDGHNLLGQAQTRADLVAGAPTLLVVLTDQDGADAMKAWFDAADTRAPANLTRKSIVSLHLPFFVSEGMARDRAKGRTPRQYWGDTLLDVRGRMARQLGLARSTTPYAFVVGPDGKVLASVHAPVDAPGTDALWKALGAR